MAPERPLLAVARPWAGHGAIEAVREVGLEVPAGGVVALMARPRLLMLDEPSLGLAPLIVRQVFQIIVELKARGSTILLVEQNARKVLQVADHAYVLEGGQVVQAGPAAALRDDPGIVEAYLGRAG